MGYNGEQSLRYAVEKWFGLRSVKVARIVAYGRSALGGRRYVCVETIHDGERLALFFFHHSDGCWSVFPPAPTMPEMKLERVAL